MRQIYLDNAAATPVDPKVLKAMTQAASLVGNPASFNNAGRKAKKAVEGSRAVIARFLGARPREIVFTASGSEANNLAILGVIKSTNNPIVLTTPIEHPSVLEPLKTSGAKIKFIPVDQFGQIDEKEFQRLLTADITLVSIMYANNEIGTIQPIKEISKAIKEFNKKSGSNVLFHVDACQAPGYLDVNIQRLGVDLLTFNGSKIYGPRGIGVLYAKSGTPVNPIVLGGSQEQGLRAGTENIMAIVGLGKAVSIINQKETAKISRLRDYMIQSLKKSIADIRLNGPEGERRLANNINISVSGLESETMLGELDKYGY